MQEENLRAGLLLEQAAHSLLRLAPAPHVRKFAFHLVLAGLRFNLCEQKGLALRAYKYVRGPAVGNDGLAVMLAGLRGTLVAACI